MDVLNYINYLIEFFDTNADPKSKPLRFEELYKYEDVIADRIYDLLYSIKNSIYKTNHL